MTKRSGKTHVKGRDAISGSFVPVGDRKKGLAPTVVGRVSAKGASETKKAFDELEKKFDKALGNLAKR